MKYIIIILLVLFGLISSAQTVNQFIGAPNTIVTNRGNFYSDSVFRMPKRLVSPARLVDTGSIYWSISDSTINAWTGSQYLKFRPGRFVDTIYSLTDSTFRYTILGNPYTVKIIGKPGTSASGLNIYNGDSTLASNRTVTQSGRYLRFADGITYNQILGAKNTKQPDSTSTYILEEIKSPYSGTAAQGMLTYYRSFGQALQPPSRPNYPLIEGFNLNAGGGAAVAFVPAIGHSLEPHYLPDPLTPTTWFLEDHDIFVTAQGKQIRYRSITINANTNLITEYHIVQNADWRDTLAEAYFSIGRDQINKLATMSLFSKGSGAGLVITADSTNNLIQFQPVIANEDLQANQWRTITFPGNSFNSDGFITVQHNGPFNIQRTSAASIVNFLDGANIRAYINMSTATGDMNIWTQAGYSMNFIPNNTQAARFITTGSFMLNTTGTTTDETSRKLYVKGSVGINKDSVKLQTVYAARQLLAIDTLTGEVVRVSLGDTATIVRSPLLVLSGAGSVPDTITIAGLNGFGTAGQAIRVNATADGFEYFTMGGGSGTVTDFSFTDGSGFDGTVTNSTTTPTLALTTTLAQNSVPYIGASGALNEENTSFFYNPTNNALYVDSVRHLRTQSPILLGGVETSATLTLQSTTGVGATDAIIFKVGNNGATTAGTFNNGGQLLLGAGTASLPSLAIAVTNLGIFRSATNTLGISAAGNTFNFTSQTIAFGTWANGQDNAIVGTNAGAGTSNRAANHMQISSGVGTGNGAASEIRLSVGTTGGSGTSLNPLLQIMRVATTGIFLNQTPNGATTDSVLSINNTSVRKIVVPNIGNTDLTLSGNRQLAGGTNSLQLGTSGSKLSSLTVNSSGNISMITDGRIFLYGNITYQTVNHNTDANLTVPDNTAIVELSSGSLTADRTITLPTAATQGQVITIAVRVTGSSNHYVLSAAVPDIKTGTTFTQLEYGTTYDFMVNSSVAWMLIRKY